MSKKYRKKALIEAEHFDGSDEMIKKYELEEHDLAEETGMQDQIGSYVVYTIETLEDQLSSVDIGDWIATGVDGGHWIITNEIFKQTYEEVEE